jgi:MerR family transcriptional regulator, copper efflux regulator
MSRSLSIGQVSNALDVSVDTLRYYERIGVIPRPARDTGGRRRYDDGDLDRLRFVLRAKRLGFTLEELAELVAFRGRPTASSKRVRELAVTKRAGLEARIEDMTRLRNELDILLNLCDGTGEHCPIVDALAQGPERSGRKGPGPQG